MTLRNLIDETFDPKVALTIEPVIKKYYDRAVQDKSPDIQALQTVLKELQAAKSQQPQQQIQSQAQSAQGAQQ